MQQPVLQQLAAAEERREALQQRLRSALVYPAVLGLASVIATSVILVVVVLVCVWFGMKPS